MRIVTFLEPKQKMAVHITAQYFSNQHSIELSLPLFQIEFISQTTGSNTFVVLPCSREYNCERREEIEKKYGTRIPYTADVVAIKMREGGREVE